MPVIKLLVEFDGTDFHGWQYQPELRSVQDTLTQAVWTLVKEEIHVNSSSRTDAGVHAIAMPVVIIPSKELPIKAYTEGLNGLLPADLKIQSAEVMPDEFHVRKSAQGKTYRYRIYNGSLPSPLTRRFSWFLKHPLDVAAMQEAGKRMVGNHDFSAFRAAHCDSVSPMRDVDSLVVERVGNEVVIEVTANAFLRNMVRIMVGTLVRVGSGRLTPEDVERILASKDRALAGETAPPQGLHLLEVRYG